MSGMSPSKKRPSRTPTAEEYERAIAKCEQTFRANKTRMWALVILREMIVAEVDEGGA